MQSFYRFSIVVLIVLMGSSLIFANGNPDEISSTGVRFDQVPQHIQDLQEQMRIAENNQQWQKLKELRQQLITEWKKVNPEVAKLYRTVKKNDDSTMPDGGRTISPNEIGPQRERVRPRKPASVPR